MNSGSYADPKFPTGAEDYGQTGSGYGIPSHSDYYNQHIHQAAAAQHAYGYGAAAVNGAAAAAHAGYPSVGGRDPMGYGGYYQQCAMSPHQQEI